ncbi:hypothetical protein JF729_07180 [Mycobacterium intracellulare]|nr:hypothetical protein [Mycobacterium intracellulare]
MNQPGYVCMRRPCLDFIDTDARVSVGDRISVGRISRVIAEMLRGWSV